MAERGARLVAPLARAFAGLAALGLIALALWGVLLILLTGFVSLQVPDPTIPDGDPCCGHPDTWGDVAVGLVWTLALVLADALVVCHAIMLIAFALRMEQPPGWTLALVPAGALAIAAVVIGLALIPLL